MDSNVSRSRLRRPSGLRAGVGIGLALALVGALVGTATGAVTPFQRVIVVNPAESPIPVTGTVSVSNTPANQNVTVTNLPATQSVSGTVNVGNLPAAPVVSKFFNERKDVDAETLYEFDFNARINVSTLIVTNIDSDDLIVRLQTSGGGEITLHHGDGEYTQNFPMPVPAAGVRVWCANLVLDCDVRVVAFGT